MPNRHICTEVVDQELPRFDRARTWEVVDKVNRGKEIDSN
jgi:hypothetical protein